MSQTPKQTRSPKPEATSSGRQADEPYAAYEEFSTGQPPGEASTIVVGSGEQAWPLRGPLHSAIEAMRSARLGLQTWWGTGLLLLVVAVCFAYALTLQPSRSKSPPARRKTSPAHVGVRPHGHRGLTATSAARRFSRETRPPRRAPPTHRVTAPHTAPSASQPAHLASMSTATPPAPPVPPTPPSPVGEGGDEQVEGGPFSP